MAGAAAVAGPQRAVVDVALAPAARPAVHADALVAAGVVAARRPVLTHVAHRALVDVDAARRTCKHNRRMLSSLFRPPTRCLPVVLFVEYYLLFFWSTFSVIHSTDLWGFVCFPMVLLVPFSCSVLFCGLCQFCWPFSIYLYQTF